MSYKIFGEAYKSRNISNHPEIRFSMTGRVAINGAAVDQIQIVAGTKWALIQDNQDKKNWFLALHNEGFVIKAEGKGLDKVFQCRTIVKIVAESLGINGSTKFFSMPISDTPEIVKENGLVLYPLITKNVKAR